MKNYSFERVRGSENGEQVELHRKRHGFRLGTRMLCLIIAFLFWLLVTNVRTLREECDSVDADTAVEQSADARGVTA